MGIEIIAMAAASCVASGYSSKAAQGMGATHSDPILAKRREAACKCTSCGSREFKQHNSALICSYCRTSP